MSEDAKIEEVNTEPKPADDGREDRRVSKCHILLEFLPDNQIGMSLNLEGVSPTLAMGWLCIVQDQVLNVQKQLLGQQMAQQAAKSISLANPLQPLPPAPFLKRGR